MGVSNYTPTGISHATSVDFSKRSVSQPIHIVQYDRTLPILAVSLYNNGQLYRLSETMEVSIRLGKPDRTFVYNKALGCDSTRTIVYFEITQQMSLFDGEFYPVIEIMDGEKIANSSTIYLVVDRNPVQHDYIESTVEYKELIDYRDEAVKAGNEAKEAAKVARESAQTVVDKTKEAVEAGQTAIDAANNASESAKSILGVEENVTRIGNMVSEKEPIITAAAETASTSATNAKRSETNAKASEEASKLSETNSKLSETNSKASEEASKLSETNAKTSETNAKVSETNAKVSETNAKASADSIEEIAKASESYAHGGTGTREGEDTDNARYYMEQAKAVSAVDIATTEKAGIVKPDGTTITVDNDGTLHGQPKVEIMTTDKVGVGKPDGTTITVDNDGTLHGQPKVEIMTTDKVGVGKPDGTTITIDEDGTLHGSAQVDEMTGATADKDGTSGTVPAPTAGQENLFLRGDGTWAKVSGGSTIAPKATVDPAISSGNSKVTISWGDPEDVVLDGAVLSAWKGTKLVMKESGYPDNESDGALILDNTVRDAYKTSGYVVDGLTNGNTYYFALFPYSTDGVYNYSASNRLIGNPNLVKLDSCTNMSLSLAMGSVTVSWTDPDAEKTVDENTATWAKTFLVYKQGSTAPSSVSDGIVAVEETTRNQYSVDGFTVDGLTDGEQYSFALFAVSTENAASDATTATANLWATLTITTGETKLYEKEVTVTYGSSTVSGTFSSIGSVTLQIPWIGETTITSTDGTDTATSVVTISAYESTYSVDLSFLKIVTFADGTDAEIAAMIEAHYNNKINIADYWAVGDMRTVHLSAMAATGVRESHRAQDVQFVIGDFEHDDLTTPINGHSKAAVTLLQKDCLMDAANASNPTNGYGNTENGYMNSTNTNVGGWKSCARRTWCNNVFFAALPSTWQSMVKIVNKKSGTGAGGSSVTEITADKIFLAAEIEIFGSRTYSVDGEGTQYQYYKNATANRYKMPKWNSSSVSHVYWERSTYGGYADRFCFVNNSGNASYGHASAASGVAPCLCI